MGAMYETVSSGTNTASTTVPMWCATGSTSKRVRLNALEIGTDVAPADQASDFALRRTSARGTQSTSFTPTLNDPADGPAIFTFDLTWSVNPTITASSDLTPIAINQRATFLQQLAPGREYVIPAVSGAGLALMSVATTAAVAYRFGHTWEE